MRKLKLFMAAAALMLGGGMTASAAQTPTADTYYYLYNPTSGLFLSRGSSYATAASADEFGLPIKLVANGDAYRIQYIDDTSHFIGDAYWSWTDQDENNWQSYTLSEQDANEHTYKLFCTSHTDDRTLYINASNQRSDPSLAKQVASNGKIGENLTDGWDLWQFLTQAEHDAIVSAYTAKNKSAIALSANISLGTNSLEDIILDESAYAAKDMSSSISSFLTAGNYSKINGGGDAKVQNVGGIEVYEGAGTFTQTITGLTNGIYKVTVNGFFRDGSNANCYSYKQSGWTVSNAYLEANGNKAMLADWASGAPDNGNPNNPEAAQNLFGQGKYLTTVYAYVSDGTLTVNLRQPHNVIGSRWLYVANPTLTFYTDQVSDEDATEILAEATECESKPMLAATKTVLHEAITAFDAVKTIVNYNTLRAAIDAAKLSAEKYAPLGTKLEEAAAVKTAVSDNSPSYVSTFDANIAAIKKDYEEGNIAEDAISAKVADAEAEIVALVKSQTANGSDMTRALPNAAGNAAVGTDNWKIENALAAGEAFHLDTWAGTASGMAVPMIEYWIANGSTLSSNTIYQTLTGLQKGVYTITATTAVNNEANVAPNAGSALLFANEETTDLTSGATETSFKGQTGDFSVSVFVADDGELKLGFKTIDPNYNWLAFKNVKIVFEGESAAAADMEALNAAITTAEAHTLGFEAGEFAPYNNVAALEALAAAKAINPNAASSSAVVAATNALTDASWTANTADVECVYNGNFAIGQGSPAADIQKYGWNRTNDWGQFQNGAEGDNTNGTVYYNQPGSMEYGNAGVYTMPLKANTIYTLTFKYASWATDSNDGITASVLNGEQGMAAIAYEANDTQYKAANSLATKTIKFVTGEAGNYVLKLANSGNTVITGVSITKDASQVLEFADGAVPTYAPGTYPAVKITRTLTAGKWATAIYPFAVSGLNKMATLESYEGTTLNFTSITESKPNEPFLMRSESDKSSIELSNVAVVAAEANEVVKGNARLIGVYAETTVSAAEGVTNYVLSSNVIYPVGAKAATVDPYRAYIQVSENAARSLKFVVDGSESTGIEGVAAADAENARVYNLNGQQVKSAQKGIFIQNGKKVVMK